MEATESISDQVERFEDFCVQKRALEGGIEVVLTKRDAKAVREVATAELELKTTKGECERIAARVTRARQGDFETTQGHRMPTKCVFTTSSAPAQPNSASPTTVPSDQPPQKDHADSQKVTEDDQKIEDDLSHEFLSLLIERYTDLCQERQILQDEIEDRLKRKERLAMEKLKHAKIHLGNIREQAVEAVAALKQASGGDTRVRLPGGAPDETHLASPCIPESAYSSGPLSPNVPPPVSPPAGTPLAAPLPGNTFSENSMTTTSLGSVLSPLPNPPRGTTIGQLADLISELRRTPAPAPAPLPPLPPPPPNPSSSNVTATQQAIFRRYDELIGAARRAGAAVSMLSIPWPLLMSHAHQFPMQNVMEKHLVNSDVVDFICLYSQWKGWNLRVDGRAMREDWEQLYSVIPEHKRGGKACVGRVVSILRELAPR